MCWGCCISLSSNTVQDMCWGCCIGLSSNTVQDMCWGCCIGLSSNTVQDMCWGCCIGLSSNTVQDMCWSCCIVLSSNTVQDMCWGCCIGLSSNTVQDMCWSCCIVLSSNTVQDMCWGCCIGLSSNTVQDMCWSCCIGLSSNTVQDMCWSFCIGLSSNTVQDMCWSGVGAQKLANSCARRPFLAHKRLEYIQVFSFPVKKCIETMQQRSSREEMGKPREKVCRGSPREVWIDKFQEGVADSRGSPAGVAVGKGSAKSSWRRGGEGISRAQLVPQWKEAGRPAEDLCVPRRHGSLGREVCLKSGLRTCGRMD
ncbi:hypothetical protein LAZ67_2005100 [Cordylochernes scorpioides]|uniref:Uncharacterized protein n=1 Tax=Cordylochernes scorpioides TaxID=51811 RepID=A0ABY6K4A6_9ARAC|nr:hypothetical protein LAZ67_2005100 [Cordylochernes scorpioides]